MDASSQPPPFVIGEGYASYRGPAIDVSAHRHAAFQIAIAERGEVAIEDAAGTVHRGEVLVVSPMSRHRMLTGTDVLRTFFVDPHLAYADLLRRRCRAGISEAAELRDLSVEDVGIGRAALDERLVAAMELATADSAWSIAGVASAVGVSPQRLRALARSQLGISLSRWRAWARLRRSAEALGAGSSLADAALEGGFADQPHMTRWMREMMGITPLAALGALRPQPRAAV